MNELLRRRLISYALASSLSIATVLIQSFEGVEYQPYRDVAGVLTVCYGHTGADIIEDKTYTQQECNQLAQHDLNLVAKRVDKLLKVPLKAHQKAALYSFVYNVGIGAFARSTLLKKLNVGDQSGACNELKRWVYAGGRKWRGLIKRREVEEIICRLDDLTKL